jgi:3-dehydroquinate synthase
MIEINVPLGADSYTISIEADALTSLPALLRQNGAGKKIVMITDNKVNALYGKDLSKRLIAGGYAVHTFSFPSGERYKSARTLARIYDWMLTHHFSRDVTVVTLGGGVVGDLGGYAAATYMRGVNFIQIPTTLLAQVDSSVGGKVGINHKLGKNVIGAFYQPMTVIIDPHTLRTLPKREITCGLAETVKYGFIADNALLSDVEHHFDKFLTLDDLTWVNDIIAQCCRIKAKVVEKDEKEQGLRRILNFGHTMGHALESATHYKYFTHGEAILWGMVGAAEISHRLGYLSEKDLIRSLRIIDAFEKPAIPEVITVDALSGLMLNDKKVSDDGLHFVLLKGLGNAVVEVIPDDVLRFGVERMLRH